MSLFRHHPDDQRHRVDRQAQRASSRRFTPGRQLLSRKPVPACHFRDHRPRRIGLRNNLALDLVAPATAKSHSNPDLKETLWFRSADYMLDHRCEPIRARWIACCTSARSQQGGEKRPLSIKQAEYPMKSTVCKGQKTRGRPLNMKRKPAITIRMSTAPGTHRRVTGTFFVSRATWVAAASQSFPVTLKTRPESFHL